MATFSNRYFFSNAGMPIGYFKRNKNTTEALVVSLVTTLHFYRIMEHVCTMRNVNKPLPLNGKIAFLRFVALAGDV